MKVFYYLSVFFLFSLLYIPIGEGKVMLGAEDATIKAFRLKFNQILNKQAWQEAWYFLPSDSDV